MILAIKVIFSVLQLQLMLCIYLTSRNKNRNDAIMGIFLIVYLIALTVVMWL